MTYEAPKDSNGLESHQYHQIHFSRMTGFPDYHETNIDRVCQFLDSSTFKAFLQFGEQDKAYNIDYAHGLELDDMYGDPFSIPRNGLDDIQYRFILKCHILAIKSDGTLPELVQFVSTVLGCSPDDVTLGMARHYVKGQLQGEPDTILIDNINIADVQNDQLLPLLASQLQFAVAADKRVLDVDFYTEINTPIWTAIGDSFASSILLRIPKDINDQENADINEFTGISNAVSTGSTFNIPGTISNTIDKDVSVNTLATYSYNSRLSLNIGDSVDEKKVTKIENNVGVDFCANAKDYVTDKIDSSSISPDMHIGVGMTFDVYLEV